MTKNDDRFSLRLADNKNVFREGMRDGIPIGLGYLAVGFSLGIAAQNAGVTAFQSFITSLLCNASAGQYVGFTMIGAGAAYIEMALVIFITNARYMLMSCAMSQRLDPNMPFWHRLVMANYITDELFGIAIARPGYMNPYYTYGAAIIASPLWAIGVALGTVAGNLLPLRLVSAFSVALYGMFLAVIIPPARKSKIIAGIIVICFAASYLAAHLSIFDSMSDGTRTIILTVAISAAAALLFPKKPEDSEAEDSRAEGSEAEEFGAENSRTEDSEKEELRAENSEAEKEVEGKDVI